jgi:hypothetical protein
MNYPAPKAKLQELNANRRQYLWKKAVTKLEASLLACASVFALVCALISVIRKESGPWLSIWASAAAMLTGSGAIFCYVSLRKVKEVKSLPYVPTVDEQIANLPVSEFLLRAANEPSDPPEELLRAAQPGASRSEEELLRPGETIAR